MDANANALTKCKIKPFLRFGRKDKTALYNMSAKQSNRVHALTIMSVATALSHVFFTIPG